MHFKLIASAVIAALLLTGTGYAVSNTSGQGAQLQQPVETTAPAAATTLTEEQAVSIALEHAGLTKAEAQRLRAAPDTYERIPHWDVEWRSGDWEYEYSIHMKTGAVLEWDRDYDPPKPNLPTKESVPAETVPPTTEPTPAETTPTTTEPTPAETTTPATEPTPAETTTPATEHPANRQLTAQEAVTVALKHAGLTGSQIRGLDTEFDRERGVPEWSVEFDSSGWEYSYEIHAETGKILDWEKERDD